MTDRRKRKRRMVPATYVPSINIMSKEGTPHLPFSSGKKWTLRLRQIAAKKEDTRNGRQNIPYDSNFPLPHSLLSRFFAFSFFRERGGIFCHYFSRVPVSN